MYNSIIHHLYIPLCVHHPKSRFFFVTIYHPLYPLLSPHTPFSPVITILLSVSMRVFFLTYFIFFTQTLPTPHPSKGSQSVLCICAQSVSILFVYFVQQIPHISEITWYLSFSDQLISFSIIPARSIHAIAKGKICFFFMAEQYSIV